MAKKKVTTKKEAPKVDLSTPFNVENASSKTLKDYAAYLEQLKVSAGWKIMEQVMTDNLRIIAQQIVEKVGLSGEPLTDEDVDELRIQHNQIQQLKNMPEALIKEFVPEEGKPEVNYDPYSSSGLPSNVLNMSNTT